MLCGVKPLNQECDTMQWGRSLFTKWEIASVISNAYRVDVKLTCHVNSFKFMGEFPGKLKPTDIFLTVL